MVGWKICTCVRLFDDYFVLLFQVRISSMFVFVTRNIAIHAFMKEIVVGILSTDKIEGHIAHNFILKEYENMYTI